MKLLIESTANNRHSMFVFSVLKNCQNLYEVTLIVTDELKALFESDHRIQAVYSHTELLPNFEGFDLFMSLSGSQNYSELAKKWGIPKRVAIITEPQKKYSYTSVLKGDGFTLISSLMQSCLAVPREQFITDFRAWEFLRPNLELRELIQKRCNTDKKIICIVIKKELDQLDCIFYLKEFIDRIKKSQDYTIILINQSEHALLDDMIIKDGFHIKYDISTKDIASLVTLADFYVGNSSWVTTLATLQQKTMLHIVTSTNFKHAYENSFFDYSGIISMHQLSKIDREASLYEQFNQLLYRCLMKQKSDQSHDYLKQVIEDNPVLLVINKNQAVEKLAQDFLDTHSGFKVYIVQKWSLGVIIEFFRLIRVEQISIVHGITPIWLGWINSSLFSWHKLFRKLKWIRLPYSFCLSNDEWTRVYITALRKS